MLFRGDFQRTLKAKLELTTFEKHLASAKSLQDCWISAVEAAPKFGFHCIRMESSGERFESGASGMIGQVSWTCRIPLAGFGFVDLARDPNGAAQAAIAAPFVDLIHSSLCQRIHELNGKSLRAPVPVSNLASPEGVG